MSDTNYASGKYVVTKIEQNRVFVERWNDPAEVLQINLPDPIPAEWAKALKPGLQVRTRPHVFCLPCDDWAWWRMAKRSVASNHWRKGRPKPVEAKP